MRFGRQLAKDTTIYAFADFVPRCVNLLLLPWMTRALTPADYGILSLVSFVSGIVEVCLVFGVDAAIARFYPECETKEKRTLLIRSLAFQLLPQAVATLSLYFICAPHLFPLLGSTQFSFRPFGLFAIALPLLYVTSTIPLIQIRMDGKPLYYAFFRISSFAISITGIVYFVIFEKEGAVGALKGQLIAAMLTAAVLIYLYRRVLFQSGLSLSLILKSWRYGTPLFFNQAASWLFNTSDRAFIQRFRTTETVGLYQMGYNFVLPLDFFINSINFAWYPHFFRSAVKPGNDEELTQDGLKIITVIYSGLLLYLCAVRYIVNFMTAETFHVAYRIAEIMVFYYGTRIVYCLVVNVLAVRDATKSIAKITILSGLGNLALNFLLIPTGGAVGAAIGTVLTGVLTIVLLLRTTARLWTVPLPGRRFFMLASLFLICGLTVVYLDFSTPQAWDWSVFVLKSGILGIYFVVLHLQGFLLPLLRSFRKP